MRLPTSLPGHTHAAAFVHVSHLMGGVHQRGGRRAAHRAAHRGAVGPERSGRSILKLTSLCRCAGPREAAFCILGAMRHRGCNGISGRVFEHSVVHFFTFSVRPGPENQGAVRQHWTLQATQVPRGAGEYAKKLELASLAGYHPSPAPEP